jgi:hypothetical protein
MTPQKLWKAITLKPELSFGRVYSRWKALREKKEMVPLSEGFRKLRNQGKIYTPSLKKVLRGRMCYKLVSERETTLGLLGLTKESNDFSFLQNFKGEGTLPYLI